MVAAGERAGRTRGEDAARRLDRGDPGRTRPVRGRTEGGPPSARARDARRTARKRRTASAETRRSVRSRDGGAHHCSSSPRRSETSFGTRRHSSQWSHCTHASEHSGWSSATSARLGPSSSSPMAAGERKSPFFLPLFSRSRSHARHAVEPGGQRDTRAIARLDARVWCARVRSRIEIDRRRCGEGAPPSGRMHASSADAFSVAAHVLNVTDFCQTCKMKFWDVSKTALTDTFRYMKNAPT